MNTRSNIVKFLYHEASRFSIKIYKEYFYIGINQNIESEFYFCKKYEYVNNLKIIWIMKIVYVSKKEVI